MTPAQKYSGLEHYARFACVIAGDDPDQRIAHNSAEFADEVDFDMPMKLNILYSPRWAFMAREIAEEQERR